MDVPLGTTLGTTMEPVVTGTALTPVVVMDAPLATTPVATTVAVVTVPESEREEGGATDIEMPSLCACKIT